MHAYLLTFDHDYCLFNFVYLLNNCFRRYDYASDAGRTQTPGLIDLLHTCHLRNPTNVDGLSNLSPTTILYRES